MTGQGLKPWTLELLALCPFPCLRLGSQLLSGGEFFMGVKSSPEQGP